MYVTLTTVYRLNQIKQMFIWYKSIYLTDSIKKHTQ